MYWEWLILQGHDGSWRGRRRNTSLHVLYSIEFWLRTHKHSRICRVLTSHKFIFRPPQNRRQAPTIPPNHHHSCSRMAEAAALRGLIARLGTKANDSSCEKVSHLMRNACTSSDDDDAAFARYLSLIGQCKTGMSEDDAAPLPACDLDRHSNTEYVPAMCRDSSRRPTLERPLKSMNPSDPKAMMEKLRERLSSSLKNVASEPKKSQLKSLLRAKDVSRSYASSPSPGTPRPDSPRVSFNKKVLVCVFRNNKACL